MLRIALITTDNREDRREYAPDAPWFGTAVQSLLDGFAMIPEEVEVEVLSCSRRRLPTPVELAPNIRFHSLHVPAWGWLKSLYLTNALAVRGLLRRLRPDLVHGQGTERDGALAAVLSGRPNVITLHGNMRRLARLASAKPWSFAGLAARLEAVAVRLAGGVVCLSSHTRELVESGARRTWLVPNAVDPAFLKVTCRRPIDAPRVLVVADLLPNKNLLAFLQAMEGLRRERPIHVRVIGKSNLQCPYARAVHDFCEKRPWCGVEPFIRRDGVRRAMTEATLLVLPSLEENLPMVVLEAMAVGLPVAASEVGGIPDLIVDRVNGVLFDPRSAASMREAVRRLVDHPGEAGRMAEAARRKVVEQHLPEVIARAHLEVYRDVIDATA